MQTIFFTNTNLMLNSWKISLISSIMIIAACGILSSDSGQDSYPECRLPVFEMHDHLPNFGFEEGYYTWLWDPGSETKEDAQKIPLLRNRNHLSIRFYEEYGEAYHDSVLEAYNIEPVWSQTFDKEVPMPGYYRVRENPADEYYTTYGDTTRNRLGNLPEVEYALPTHYRNEQFCDLSTTPKILFTFHDQYTEEQREQILDSLKTADNVELRQLFDYESSKPHMYVTKASRMDPYSLYHHYYEHLPYFRSISLNFAQTAMLLRP